MIKLPYSFFNFIPDYYNTKGPAPLWFWCECEQVWEYDR